VPYREPDNVQFDPRRLALACTAATRLGAVEPFSRSLFRALFVDGISPLDDEVCVMLAQGEPRSSRFPSRLEQPETAADLAATVQEAVARGVFGVPTFVLGDQIYFGNDRLVLLRHALSSPRPGP
jgi:2-hydroxychromene-2-carboxylate isomerase